MFSCNLYSDPAYDEFFSTGVDPTGGELDVGDEDNEDNEETKQEE